MVAAEALAHAGMIDGERLAEIKRGSGHLDLASDLVALGALFDVSWGQVEDNTFVQRAQVEEASRIGTMLLVALGTKNHPASRESPEAVDRKHRAFTLLVRAYDGARRALTYLRWHDGDVDLVAPSLYKRPKRRAAVEEVVEGEDAPVADDAEVDDQEIAPGSAPGEKSATQSEEVVGATA